jgi:DNA topoisomerase-1
VIPTLLSLFFNCPALLLVQQFLHFTISLPKKSRLLTTYKSLALDFQQLGTNDLKMNQGATLSHEKILKLDRDYKQAAKAARLIYVSDIKPGIERHKKAGGYTYSFSGKSIKDKARLERIKKLAIPPSWTNVWICANETGHIQATGIDLNGRKQYRYHAEWNKLRNETKFHRLYEFGKVLPVLRRRIKKDMADPVLSEQKVLATVVNLMEHTYIRVGNNGYEKLYGSYGLTTLKDKHVTIKKEDIRFSFTGKKGVEHSITIKSKRLARIIRQCKDIPGKELFQYYTAEGDKKSIDSGMVNNYIKEITQGEFTAKDFRTWAGSLQALQCFRALDETLDATIIKKNIVNMLNEVSSKLGNSRSICKKYYVHPALIRLYEENKLKNYFQSVPVKRKPESALSVEEKILMQTLKKKM